MLTNHQAVSLKSRTIEGFNKKLFKKIWSYRAIYVMLLPAVSAYLVFNYWPMYGVLIAFKDFMITKGVWGSPWVGLDNFRRVFETSDFWRVFFNTIYLNFLRMVWGFPAPIILALLLNELRKHYFKRIVQTIIYLPHFVSWVTIAGIVFSFLSIEEGLVNKIILNFGGTPHEFITNPDFFRPLVVITHLWKETGWGTIIYFAAICSIQAELYEASVIDGASRWQQVRYITIPGIAPTISILFIFSMGGLVSGGGFDQIFNLYNPLVYETADVIDTFVFRRGITEGNFELATAVGLFLSIINFAILMTTDKVAKKIGGVGIY